MDLRSHGPDQLVGFGDAVGVDNDLLAPLETKGSPAPTGRDQDVEDRSVRRDRHGAAVSAQKDRRRVTGVGEAQQPFGGEVTQDE